jgi:4-hydroxybenzoate polyprenyltransferase
VLSGVRALREILSDIKLTHSVFALPFAFVGLVIGTRGQLPDPWLLAKVLAAMVLARSAAMGWNRLADRRLDATNPRTQARALPAGRVTPATMTAFVVLCALGFVAVAASINALCLWLTPVVLAVLFAYSLSKRFTVLAHLFVGLALALSPPAAYVAARGAIEADVVPVLWLGLAVLFWVAGFDIIYACQDIDHDRRESLRSLPSRLGAGRALWIARGLHVLMLLALALTVTGAGLGALSWAAVAVVAALLLVEHRIVTPGNLSRVNAAFFTVNGVVSVFFGVLVVTDLLQR